MLKVAAASGRIHSFYKIESMQECLNKISIPGFLSKCNRTQIKPYKVANKFILNFPRTNKMRECRKLERKQLKT